MDILERAHKLLALTESDVEGEARNAAVMLANHIRDHGLELKLPPEDDTLWTLDPSSFEQVAKGVYWDGAQGYYMRNLEGAHVRIEMIMKMAKTYSQTLPCAYCRKSIRKGESFLCDESKDFFLHFSCSVKAKVEISKHKRRRS